jgi:hypothetical protein
MATKANLVIDQGSTFLVELDLKDENGDILVLSGYSANSQIRKWYTSSNASATFATSINTAAGAISLSLTSEETSGLVAGRYVYDVEIQDGSSTTRIIEGIVTVTPQVTR